jgi:hypothetical protein
MSVDARDHSLNLVSEPDERDERYGIERLADGRIRQREKDDDPPKQETDADRRG